METQLHAIIPFKNRQLNPKFPVQVYRNLHKRGTIYSVRQFGKVIGHAKSLGLTNCQFIVRESGRQRVIKSGRKNVHAWVKGFIANKDYGIQHNEIPIRVSYNPKKNSSFVGTLGYKERKLFAADYVIISSGLVLAYSPQPPHSKGRT